MAVTTAPDKSLYRTRVDAEMAEHVKSFLPAWSIEEKLALGARMLAAEQHFRGGLAGQISARVDDQYLTLAFGMGFDEATPGDFVAVDEDLRPLRGKGMPNPATRFHVWVYRTRPQTRAIVHTHPPAVSALSMLGEELAVAHMDATPFFDDCAFLREWPGLPIADNEGEIISEALGRKNSILLAHHGLLTTGNTLEEAVVRALWLEQAADIQLRARAVGGIRPIRPELAEESRDFLLKPEVVNLTFAYFARRVLRREPGCLG
jgi:L-fuculose-phosphate aldolase